MSPSGQQYQQYTQQQNGAPNPYAAVYSPHSNQAFISPQGQPMQPGSPPVGTQAFMSVKLPDGTMSYVPVVSQMVGGRQQWLTSNGQVAAVAPTSGNTPQPVSLSNYILPSHWDPDLCV